MSCLLECKRRQRVGGCVIGVFKQKTAYEVRISDWSSDVCSSDLVRRGDNDVNALLDRAQQGIENNLLAARAGNDFAGVVLQAVFPTELRADCFLEFRCTAYIGVFRA